MITPDKALKIIFDHIRPLTTMRQPLDTSIGFCLAETIRADRDMPPADRSAMDGYAVRSSDLRSIPCTLRLTAEVAAGSSDRPRVRHGTCVRILTGANIPPGADTVVMLEHTTERGQNVTVHRKARQGANIRRRGEEARKGTVLLDRGTVLSPLQTGLCAAAGKSMVRVYAHPSAGVIITGREVRRAGESVRSHEVRDSNGPALSAALKSWGFSCGGLRMAPDNIKAISRLLDQMIQKHDVVFLTGGVSVGQYDYVPQAIKEISASIRFHHVAMKPGKPQLYATLGRNRHIFGLPGNPLSVLTGFHEFALPALRRLAGMPVEQCQPEIKLPLAGPAEARQDGRMHCIPARLIWKAQGPSVMPMPYHGSADMASVRQTDGVIVIPSGVTKWKKGLVVSFRPWRPLP